MVLSEIPMVVAHDKVGVVSEGGGNHPQSKLPFSTMKALHSRFRISVSIQPQNCRTALDSERRW